MILCAAGVGVSAMMFGREMVREYKGIPYKVDDEASSNVARQTRILSTFAVSDRTSNTVCSPAGIQYTASVLSMCTGGETRDQILKTLYYASPREAQEAVDQLNEECNYETDIGETSQDDERAGHGTSLIPDPNKYESLCRLNASLWFNDAVNGVSYNENEFRKIMDSTSAIVYTGDLASDGMAEQLQTWVNDATGGRQEAQAKIMRFGAACPAAAMSAIYYKAPWKETYAYSKQAFYAKDRTADVQMLRTTSGTKYYEGKHFTGACALLKDENELWFLLPKDDASPDSLFSDTEAVNLLQHKDPSLDIKPGASIGDDTQGGAIRNVQLTFPQFDPSQEKDMTAGLKQMGITDVFDPSEADFSPVLKKGGGVYVGQMEHAARLTADSQGIFASAYTVIPWETADTSKPYEEPVKFTADHPFAYAVKTREGNILFAGVVNDPAQ